MNITYAGKSPMLFNEEPLRGTPKTVQKLAQREAALSEAVSAPVSWQPLRPEHQPLSTATITPAR